MTAAPEIPQAGGSYIRQPDGSLIRAGETTGAAPGPSADAAVTPPVTPPAKPAKKDA